jgi:hypothetical protein
LCPAVDDVRAYVIALTKDLVKTYGVKRIELETCNFGGYGHAHYHVKDGTDLGNIGNYLFSLSFSAGAVEKARARGIDIDGLRRWTIEQLDRIFERGEPLVGSIEKFVQEHAELAAFQTLREELVSSLIDEIKVATEVEVSFC